MDTHLLRLLAEMQERQAELVMRCAELERRMDTQIRHGKVTEVDPQKQVARIEIGERDGKPVKSAWLPYAQFAGPDGDQQYQKGLKHHSPPFVGQQMTMFAPGGEIRQGVLLPFHWWDKAKSPSNKGDEHVIAWDKLRITRRADALIAQVGNSVITWKDDSLSLKSNGSEIELKAGHINLVSGKVHTVAETHLGVDAKDDEGDTKVVLEDGLARKPVKAKTDGSGGLAAAMAAAAAAAASGGGGGGGGGGS